MPMSIKMPTPPGGNTFSTGLYILLMLFLSNGNCFSQNKKTDRAPNVIFIMADDLGYGDLGCYGQKEISTPRIDQLAKEGMRFTDHYSGHTVCRPSRLVLWTGKHSGHTAIWSNADYVLKPEDVTVAEILKKKGYRTGGVGKWAMGNTENEGHPNKNGFDFWMGYLDQSEAHNYYPTHLWRNYEKVMLPGNVLSEAPAGHGNVSSQRVTYAHDVITNEALQFIRENKDSTFLLHVHWTVPHANNEALHVMGDGMEVPEYGAYADKPWPSTEKGFAAMITRKDRDVGRIVDLLKELKIEENTIVFVTSDNGPHGEGGHDYQFFKSNGPLRGYKRDLYEGGIRIPMIAYWPGHIKPNTVTDLPVAFWDHLPTACELAGITPPDSIDGISYLPALLNTKKQKKHDYLFWKSSDKKSGTQLAVRHGKWKGIRQDYSQPVELYDLSTDVGEKIDLAHKHPDMVKKIEAMMKEADTNRE
jgi:arylsulfatase A-like enzyme